MAQYQSRSVQNLPPVLGGRLNPSGVVHEVLVEPWRRGRRPPSRRRRATLALAATAVRFPTPPARPPPFPVGVYTADITFDDLKARFNQVGGRVGTWWVLPLRGRPPRGVWAGAPGQLAGKLHAVLQLNCCRVHPGAVLVLMVVML